MHYCFIINNEPGKSGNAEVIRNGIESLQNPIDYELYLTTAEKSAIHTSLTLAGSSLVN